MSTHRYKTDLRHPGTPGARLGGRNGWVSDKAETDNARQAVADYRGLLAREDLDGKAVAARLVVANRSLYYSQFDKPFGSGRIHPDAPLNADAGPEQAQEMATWIPA